MSDEFERKILKKFGVMPFKQSDGGMGLAGKGVSHSYDYTENLEQKLKQKNEIIRHMADHLYCYCDDVTLCEFCVYLKKPEVQEILKGVDNE